MSDARPSSGSIRARLYAISFADEVGPLYSLFTLLFNDNGITTAQISVVFVLWAVVAIALEIPSGALADRVDRRRLLAVAFVLRAVGISVWMLWPTFEGMLVGAALWSVHSSLASGAWEALIHDELAAIDRADDYGTVIARVAQFSNLGIATGAVVAFVAVRLGSGIEALGWVTVALHAVSIPLVLALPDVRWVAHGERDGDDGADDEWSYAAWWSTLRTGVGEARSTSVVFRLLLLGTLLEGLFVVDEYVALLVRDRGGGDSLAPVFMFLVFVGLLAGGEVAARRPQLGGPAVGGALALGAAAMLVTTLTDAIWTIGLIAVGYATLETTWLVSDARFQQRIPARTRATVTSVRAFGSGIVNTVAFVVVAVLADGDDPSPGLVVMVAVLLVAGLLATRWIPPFRPTPERTSSGSAVEPDGR